MDGLRKVPDNVPNRDMIGEHLGKPLTRVPDPFCNEFRRFGAHNNARLRAFLDHFGFDYEFVSSTDYYTSGRFDAALLRMLARFDQVMEIILPTLREERAQPIRRSCPSAHAPAWCCRSRWSRTTPRPAPSPTSIPTRGSK